MPMSTANLNIVHVAPRTEFSFCFLYVIDPDIVHQELVARLGDGSRPSTAATRSQTSGNASRL